MFCGQLVIEAVAFVPLGATSHDLKKNVRSRPDFVAAIAEFGVVEWGKGSYFTGFYVHRVEAPSTVE